MVSNNIYCRKSPKFLIALDYLINLTVGVLHILHIVAS